MTHTHAKGLGQRLLGSKVRLETDGRTETITLLDSLMLSVDI